MSRSFHSKGSKDAPRRAFIAVPAYGPVPPGFIYSLWNSHIALSAAGISADLCILSGHCHVDDSRNLLVRNFLETDCTDLVFIDSDVVWDAVDLVKLVSYDRDVVAGSYPLKQPNDGFPVRPIQGEIWAEHDGLVEVEGVPTGFLRIRRAVLERLAEDAPKFRGQKESADRKSIPIIFERTYEDGSRYGGDYAFCRKWRSMGGKIYVAPEMTFEHFGEASWKGSLGQFWRKSHGVSDARFRDAIANVREGTETGHDINSMAEYWGNIPWTAGSGLITAWAQVSRESEGPILECGAGLTSLVAAAANPNQIVYAIEHDYQWQARIEAEANRLGISNLKIIPSTISDGWYEPKEPMPGHVGAVLIDGPPRDLSDRTGLFRREDIDLTGAIVVWDDLDQTVMHKMVAACCALYGAEPTVITHPTKSFAMAKLGGKVNQQLETENEH